MALITIDLRCYTIYFSLSISEYKLQHLKSRAGTNWLRVAGCRNFRLIRMEMGQLNETFHEIPERRLLINWSKYFEPSYCRISEGFPYTTLSLTSEGISEQNFLYFSRHCCLHVWCICASAIFAVSFVKKLS